MTILVTGVESSGTKLAAHLLERAGARVVHSSPHYRLEQGKELHDGLRFDAVVVVVRSSHPHIHSMVEAGHAKSLSIARLMAADGLALILDSLQTLGHVHLITYESLVYEPDALKVLCNALGLRDDFEHDEVGNGNAKYYGGEVFRDDRPLHER